MGDIGYYCPVPFSRWFTGGVNFHFQMSYTAIVVQLNHGMPCPNPWKAIYFIGFQRIALADYRLYRNRILPKHRKKTVSFCRYCMTGNQQNQCAGENVKPGRLSRITAS